MAKRVDKTPFAITTPNTQAHTNKKDDQYIGYSIS